MIAPCAECGQDTVLFCPECQHNVCKDCLDSKHECVPPRVIRGEPEPGVKVFRHYPHTF